MSETVKKELLRFSAIIILLVGTVFATIGIQNLFKEDEKKMLSPNEKEIIFNLKNFINHGEYDIVGYEIEEYSYWDEHTLILQEKYKGKRVVIEMRYPKWLCPLAKPRILRKKTKRLEKF